MNIYYKNILKYKSKNMSLKINDFYSSCELLRKPKEMIQMDLKQKQKQPKKPSLTSQRNVGCMKLTKF